jgi:hypothetical protein
MKSTMTEKDARTALATAWNPVGMIVGDSLWTAIKEVLGLEFAPEPHLPGRLSTSIVHPVSLVPGMHCERWATEAERRLSYEQAAARHNAYPGLREAATRFCQRVKQSNSLFATDDFAALEAELAKGPK